MPPSAFTAADAELIASDSYLTNYYRMQEETLGWVNFVPRPDKPESFDQQESFCLARDKVSFLIGGNAAGTTEAAAYKTAQFVLHRQPPPRRDTPFWIISNNYEQTGSVCWAEKLEGHGHIPPCEVEHERIRWNDHKRNWPFSVPLKPWPGKPGKNWCLEFKSYEQGRQALQARSIGGFWFSEQFPLDLFLETLRGTREYMFPGGQFCEFTPIEPELCMWIEKAMDDQPDGWQFYRANTEMNRPNLADGWFDQFFSAVPEEMRETRMTGALASFEGVIYEYFNPEIHIIHDRVTTFPPGVRHFRGVDWGASMEHPFVCVWGCVDGVGNWLIYDEYWQPSQSCTIADHAEAILEKSEAWGWKRRNPHYGVTFADPSRPGDINNFNAMGIPTAPACNEVYEGINTVRSVLKFRPNVRSAGLVFHERCKHTIEEHRKYRWKRGKRPGQGNLLNPQVAVPVPLKRDDDCCDASRYMIHSVKKNAGNTPSSMSHDDYSQKRRSIQHRTSEENREPVNRMQRMAGGVFRPS